MVSWTRTTFWVLLLRLCQGDTTTTTRRRVIDLSYRHNIDAETLASVIRQEGESFEGVDVSGSALGDKGVERILHAILSSSAAAEEQDVSSAPSLSLIAHTNGVTPKGATKLIEMILNPDEKRNVDDLDLSWNHLHADAAGTKTFYKSLEKLLENATQCPRVLRLDRCGLGASACRAIGKGLIHRYTHNHPDQTVPACLSLCGNSAIGDAGAAAIAAALRFVATSEDKKSAVLLFERLDLSACDIGDTGVEALALALESAPCCLVQHLDLSNNRITERGAEALARALATAAGNRKDKSSPLLESLDLSNNKIGDSGASSIATCLIANGDIVPSIFLRSCHVHADGAESIGRALRKFAQRGSAASKLALDLSGNPFGVLRGKSKGDGGKYSASRLKSKASATAASYMNQGISFLKKGLKDVGVDMGQSSTAESDDEEEKRSETLMDGDIDPSRARCGGRALSAGFHEPLDTSDLDSVKSDASLTIQLGLRHCYFDHAAADALAEMKVVAADDLGVNLQLDVRLNSVLEEDMVSALHGEDDDQLREMAEAHTEKMSVIRDAEERAKAAARRVGASSRRNDYGNDGFGDYGGAWDAPAGFDTVSEDGERWDSDADYDDDPY